jgi:hypothetical protein
VKTAIRNVISVGTHAAECTWFSSRTHLLGPRLDVTAEGLFFRDGCRAVVVLDGDGTDIACILVVVASHEGSQGALLERELGLGCSGPEAVDVHGTLASRGRAVRPFARHDSEPAGVERRVDDLTSDDLLAR